MVTRYKIEITKKDYMICINANKNQLDDETEMNEICKKKTSFWTRRINTTNISHII